MTEEQGVRRPRRTLLAVAVAVVGLVAISLVQATAHRHSIEDNLTQRSTQALEAAGLSGVGVQFVGRDGTLTVPSSVDGERALAVVAELDGVRVVALRGPAVAIAASSAPPATTPAPDVRPTTQAPPTSAPSSSAPPQTQLATLPQITFQTGSATLTAQGRASVARAAAILKANPEIRVRIEGNTDSFGAAAANLALSRARARTVLDALRASGIDAARISAVGYGESRPKVPNTSPANQAINRRVEFIVVP